MEIEKDIEIEREIEKEMKMEMEIKVCTLKCTQTCLYRKFRPFCQYLVDLSHRGVGGRRGHFILYMSQSIFYSSCTS
jgi:hypothetical protein